MNSRQWAIEKERCCYLSLLHKWIISISNQLNRILFSFSHFFPFIFIFNFIISFIDGNYVAIGFFLFSSSSSFAWLFIHYIILPALASIRVQHTPLIVAALCLIEKWDFTSFSALLIILWNSILQSVSFFLLLVCCTTLFRIEKCVHFFLSSFSVPVSLHYVSACVTHSFLCCNSTKSLKGRKKSERKISHFNIDIAPVDVSMSIIKHEIPM